MNKWMEYYEYQTVLKNVRKRKTGLVRLIWPLFFFCLHLRDKLLVSLCVGSCVLCWSGCVGGEKGIAPCRSTGGSPGLSCMCLGFFSRNLAWRWA